MSTIIGRPARPSASDSTRRARYDGRVTISAESSEPVRTAPGNRRAWSWVAIFLVAGGATFAFKALRSGDSVPAAAPRVEPSPTTGARSGTANITQIMIMYDRDRGGAKARLTKREAYELAKDLIARIRKGETMESLVNTYTDDIFAETGKPMNRGESRIAATSPAVPAIKKAAFSTGIGELAPEPIDSGLAYHVIRRDL